MSIEKVVVIGGGTMGLDIAQVFARSGKTVVVRDISDELIKASEARLIKGLDKLVAKGKMDEAGKAAITGKMSFTVNLEDAADAAAVNQAVADVAQEQGQVAGAAAGDDGDLAVLLVGGAVAAKVVRRALDLVGVGGVDALEHLVDVVLRGVDDLLHGSCVLSESGRTSDISDYTYAFCAWTHPSRNVVGLLPFGSKFLI